MSVIVFPVFQDPSFQTAHQSLTTGEFLSGAGEILDELADEHGLVSFTAFMDNREIPDDFEGDPDELEEMMGPCEDWYDPLETVSALEAMAKLIRSNADAASALEDSEAVAADLTDLAAAIRPAIGKGIGVRLDFSY